MNESWHLSCETGKTTYDVGIETYDGMKLGTDGKTVTVPDEVYVAPPSVSYKVSVKITTVTVLVEMYDGKTVEIDGILRSVGTWVTVTVSTNDGTVYDQLETGIVTKCDYGT